MEEKNLTGKTILGYKVCEKLGSGAFGTVYKAVKTNASGCFVRALKHITIPSKKQYSSVFNSMGGDISKANNYFAEKLQNIVAEIQILNNLSEKGAQHIVRYYDNDIVTQDSPRKYDVYILMEYLTPLEDYMENRDVLVRDIVKLGLDVLDGLRVCHDNGVIHRDVKDENIFISADGEFKIGDFGVSKVLKDSSKAESLKGTPNFLAPEVYLGKEGYTKSVDLYSLGIVLYRLLNYNRNPFLPHFPEQFYSEDEDRAFEKRMKGETPDLPSLGGGKIGEVIVKAISSPDRRFKTAEGFFYALKSAASETEEDILLKKVNLNVNVSERKESDGYGKTVGETVPEEEPGIEKIQDGDVGRISSIHKYLFESISYGENEKQTGIQKEGKESIQTETGKAEDIEENQTDKKHINTMHRWLSISKEVEKNKEKEQAKKTSKNFSNAKQKGLGKDENYAGKQQKVKKKQCIIALIVIIGIILSYIGGLIGLIIAEKKKETTYEIEAGEQIIAGKDIPEGTYDIYAKGSSEGKVSLRIIYSYSAKYSEIIELDKAGTIPSKKKSRTLSDGAVISVSGGDITLTLSE